MPIPDLDALLKKSQFEGMLPTETALTKLFLEKHGREFDRIDFHVGVGDGGETLPQWSQEMRDLHKARTQKRIDFMVWHNDAPVIVEVKKRLRVGDVGQLLSYRLLWMAQNPGQGDPVMLAISYDGDQDVLKSLRAHGIDVELYPMPSE